MNKIFNALLKEAQFTKEVLCSGATQIRKCNYAQKGVYFQAFTSLSVGMERIGKLCLMLDFYSNNGGRFPDDDCMRREIGHNINKLYARSVEISQRKNIVFGFPTNLDSQIYANILKVLSNFATGDRYSNIDILVDSAKIGDPLKSWYNEVDLLIFEKHVSAKKKATIAQNAHLVNVLFGGITVVRHTSETGEEITDTEDASFRTGVQEAVAPYRQLFVLQIIRFWVEILGHLRGSATGVGSEDIPYMNEIFGRFYNPDSYLKTRKKWD